jgi:hypothetical protein
MKIESINISVIGISQKDYEFIGINRDCKEFKAIYLNKKSNIYWNICVYGIIEYKLISTELTNQGNFNLPNEGVVFEFLDSPWIDEFERILSRKLEKCHHYVLKFQNCIIEFIAQQLVFEQRNEKP